MWSCKPPSAFNYCSQFANQKQGNSLVRIEKEIVLNEGESYSKQVENFLNPILSNGLPPSKILLEFVDELEFKREPPYNQILKLTLTSID
jgi:hypothetical protein